MEHESAGKLVLHGKNNEMRDRKELGKILIFFPSVSYSKILFPFEALLENSWRLCGHVC